MSVRRGGRPPTPPPTLRRMLGLREAVALGIGGTVGGGIFVLVGATAGMAGPAALLAYLLAFVASLAIALPYAELACRLPLAGCGRTPPTAPTGCWRPRCWRSCPLAARSAAA